MTPPDRPQPWFDPDPLTVSPEPLDDRIPVHPKPYRLVPDSPRRGCSVLGFLVLATLLVWYAAPRSAANPTGSQPGASGAIGSVDASARVQAAASGLPPTPALHRFSPAVPSGASEPIASVPAPSIDTAVFPASATWCAPTPTQCGRWGGDALLAALPTYTGTPYRVRVWRGSRHVDVTVVSVCGCGIDLSPHAFEQLAPLSRGRVDVLVEGPLP